MLVRSYQVHVSTGDRMVYQTNNHHLRLTTETPRSLPPDVEQPPQLDVPAQAVSEPQSVPTPQENVEPLPSILPSPAKCSSTDQHRPFVMLFQFSYFILLYFILF